MSENPVNKIKNIIKGNDKKFTVDDIPEIHEIFMSEYGWIPIKEFGELPIPTFWSILESLSKRKNKEQEQYKKAQKR